MPTELSSCHSWKPQRRWKSLWCNESIGRRNTWMCICALDHERRNVGGPGAVLGKTFGGPGPLNFPFSPLFPTSFPSLFPCPLNFPSHPSPPFPFHFPLPFPFSRSLSSPPSASFLPLPFLPLEVGPLNPARGSGGVL